MIEHLTAKLKLRFRDFILDRLEKGPVIPDYEGELLRSAWIQTAWAGSSTAPERILIAESPTEAVQVIEELRNERCETFIQSPTSRILRRSLTRTVSRLSGVVSESSRKSLQLQAIEMLEKHPLGPFNIPWIIRGMCEQSKFGQYPGTSEAALREVDGSVFGAAHPLAQPGVGTPEEFGIPHDYFVWGFLAEYAKLQPGILDGPLTLMSHCAAVHSTKRTAIIVRRPRRIHLDVKGRLHRTDGPAIEFHNDDDNQHCFFVEGVKMPPRLICAPETYEPERLLGIKNAEIRRIVTEKMGIGRFLEFVQAKEISQDDYGRLYETQMIPWRPSQPAWYGAPPSGPMRFVRLLNFTPEPGTTDVYKEYLLQVPPEVTTPRAAVAWTFDVPESEYAPTTQS